MCKLTPTPILIKKIKKQEEEESLVLMLKLNTQSVTLRGKL